MINVCHDGQQIEKKPQEKVQLNTDSRLIANHCGLLLLRANLLNSTVLYIMVGLTIVFTEII